MGGCRGRCPPARVWGQRPKSQIFLPKGILVIFIRTRYVFVTIKGCMGGHLYNSFINVFIVDWRGSVVFSILWICYVNQSFFTIDFWFVLFLGDAFVLH